MPRRRPRASPPRRLIARLPEPLERRVLLSSYTVTNANDSGPGSLRQAIIDCNLDAGPDNIVFAPNTDPIVLSSGALDVTGDLTIDGGMGITIDANRTGRVLQIEPGATLNMSAVLVTGGRAPAGQSGGGILNAGTLTLSEVSVFYNQIAPGPAGSAAGSGGGVFNSGTLTMNACSITINQAGDGSPAGATGAGGDGGSGGGVYSTGTLRIVDSDFLENQAGSGADAGAVAGVGGVGGKGGNGGGLFATGPTLILNSTFYDNAAGDGGAGGQVSVNPGQGGAGGSGGGIYAAGATTAINTTITRNYAGGGGSQGTDNSAAARGPDGCGSGFASTGQVALGNTIIAGDFVHSPALLTLDISGPITSDGHNLIGIGEGSSGWVASDRTGSPQQPVDPKLSLLGSYGGETASCVPAPGSPVIDGGDNALAASFGLTTDQRGFPRVANGTVDIGAFEVQPLVVNSLDDVTAGPGPAPLSGRMTLRSAIGIANADPGPDTITFAPGLGGTISLDGWGELEIRAPLTIHGPGPAALIINASQLFRVFHIDAGAALSADNLTITNGLATEQPGNGGGVLNEGTLTLDNVVVTGNQAGAGNFGMPGGAGGGIYNSGTVTLTHCTISDNRAADGGYGITTQAAVGGSGGGIYSSGALVITNSTITGNAAGSGGGALNPDPRLGVGGAGGDGGGIAAVGGSVQIVNSTIALNVAGNGGQGSPSTPTPGAGGVGGNGGGIFLATDATLVNDTIAQNSAGLGGAAGGSTGRQGAAGSGGGVAHGSGGTIAMGNDIVSRNAAEISPDVLGAISSRGHNLIAEIDGSSGWTGADYTGTADSPLDARLAQLGDHGGPTQTMALLPGSPALDHGSNALASAAGLTTDQRGLARVFNGTVDIGAYEAQPPAVRGDVNHDGTTNFADLLLLAQHYGSAAVPLYELGDLTGDGSVSFADLLLLAQNYGRGTQGAATLKAARAARHRGSGMIS